MILHLEDPIYFALLIPVAVAGWRMCRGRSRDRIVFASFSDIPERRITWRIVLAGLAPFLFLTALTLIVLALARPQSRSSTEVRRTDAVAIEMVLDVSGSMAKPEKESGGEPISRLELVKRCFATFVKQRPDDLIGLITFGGYAVTRAPLTIDHDALLQLLAGVAVPGRAPAERRVVGREELLTAIGDALAVACARLREADVKSKLIVLLTDGESNAGLVDPDTAMRIAERLGIRVHTIGVGEPGSAPPSNEEVAADAALLKRISNATGGLYFDAASPKELAGVLHSIDELEKTEVETFAYSRNREIFHRFLIPALFLVLLSVTSSMLIRRRLI